MGWKVEDGGRNFDPNNARAGSNLSKVSAINHHHLDLSDYRKPTSHVIRHAPRFPFSIHLFPLNGLFYFLQHGTSDGRAILLNRRRIVGTLSIGEQMNFFFL